MDFNTAITIILAALGAVLAALAIFIAVGAIFGYGGIKEAIQDAATKKAIEVAEKKLLEYFADDAIKDKIKRMVDAERSPNALAGASIPYEEEGEDHGRKDDPGA